MAGLSDYQLDVFGQQPGLNIYTQICFCYPVAENDDVSRIVDTLNRGLERLSESFPWIAGQVVNEGASEGNTGVFKIKPLDKTPRLIVKDLRHESTMASMDELREASFPFRMLDETSIAPRSTLPGIFNESSDSTNPVFLLQATFIKQGFILTFLGQHQVLDGTGQGHVISLFSRACRNESFTKEELEQINMDRKNVIPLLTPKERNGNAYQKRVAHQTKKPAKGPPPPSSPLPNFKWVYFLFSSSSLKALKALASQSLPTTTRYVTTDDSLSAFIWQAVARARLARLSKDTESVFARAVNVRSYIGVPELYPGMAQNMTYNRLSLEKLASEPLGAVAAQLRAELDPVTSSLGVDTKAMATFYEESKDKSIASVTASIDLAKDITLSSWAKQDSYDLDFGLQLGKPEAVRRPQFTPVESLMYLMPKKQDGEIAAAICLREEDLEIVKSDEQFIKYAKYVA
ncbi:trichothecene 3-O-acetyltransferase [Trichomonascus vanleenenianus]|uniref:acetyltransferase n=1 Tax=Trichomonascus vanleenenianus TaxID=2268995 RepID=UPI003ECB461F